MSLITKGEAITERLVAENRSALRAWAIVEASGFLWRPPRRLQDEVRSLCWTGAHHDVTTSALRDTLMTLSRMTDAPKGDKQSLFELGRILRQSAVQAELVRRARLWNDPGLSGLADYNATLCQQEIDWFLSRLGEFGIADKITRPYRLEAFRNNLKPLRDQTLAHALAGGTSPVKLRELRLFLMLASRMCQAASMSFLGKQWPALDHYRIRISSQRLLRRALEDFGPGPLAHGVPKRPVSVD